MSIPKEPRQLMINLMYLVLMALLALNISAEIMNAFYGLEKSMQTSNALSVKSVEGTVSGIQEILKKKPKLQAPLNGGISEIRGFVGDFTGKIDKYKAGLTAAALIKNEEVLNANLDEIISKSTVDQAWTPGGEMLSRFKMKDGVPTDEITVSKDKDWTTWLMVKKGKGAELYEFIDSTRNQMIDIYAKTMRACQSETKMTNSEIAGKIDNFTNNLTLSVEVDSTITDSEEQKEAWVKKSFYQMPYAACMPILEKFKSDARSAEAMMVNDLASLVGGREIKLNKFFPIMNAKKGYVIKGEKFEAEVAIGAFSDEFARSAKIQVNGQGINLNAEGKGSFTETANSLGKRTLKLTATVVNPLTGETMNGSSSFEYEVGVRSATVSAAKMNVFYIGVDNPVEVSVAGANSNNIKASCSGGGCNMSGGNGKYNVKVSSPGQAKITVSAEGFTQSFDFRVKRIPTPAPSFNPNEVQAGGALGNGRFGAQRGIFAVLENFDFEAKCNIQGFQITRVPQRKDPQRKMNSGPTFSGDVAGLVRAAKPGDTYYFDEIKARCPGDGAGRKLPPMVWTIQ